MVRGHCAFSYVHYFTYGRGIYINNLEYRINIVKDEEVNLSMDANINPTDEYFSGKEGLDKLIQKRAGEKLCKRISKICSCEIGSVSL